MYVYKMDKIIVEVLVIMMIVCMQLISSTEEHIVFEVSIDSTFPRIILASSSSSSSCSYTLTGIYESQAKQNYFDPRIDTDIAGSRIVISDVLWIIEHRNTTEIALIGVPRPGSSIEAKHRFSSIEIILILNQNISNAETATAEVKVDIRDYHFVGIDDNPDEESLVLILEWKLATSISMDSVVTRNRRRITAGNCVYDAGNKNAVDDNDQGIRCEVRFEKKAAADVVLYQSYAHFNGSVIHTGASIAASTIINENTQEHQKSFDAHLVPFVCIILGNLYLSFMTLIVSQSQRTRVKESKSAIVQ